MRSVGPSTAVEPRPHAAGQVLHASYSSSFVRLLEVIGRTSLAWVRSREHGVCVSWAYFLKQLGVLFPAMRTGEAASHRARVVARCDAITSYYLSLVLLYLVGYPACLHPPTERRQRRFATSSRCRFTASSRCRCTIPSRCRLTMSSRCRFTTSSRSVHNALSVSVHKRPPGVGSVHNVLAVSRHPTPNAERCTVATTPTPTLNGLQLRHAKHQYPPPPPPPPR